MHINQQFHKFYGNIMPHTKIKGVKLVVHYAVSRLSGILLSKSPCSIRA